MAYSQSAAPLPPPPPGVNYAGSREFSNNYSLAKNASTNLAQNGVAPVNQMTNGFGGRQGDAATASQPVAWSGNRTSQHVATPGNNNVSYANNGMLQSAQTLWQKSQQQGAPAPMNGMSLGYIKNTAQRPSGVPVPPPPTATTGGPQPSAPTTPAPTPESKAEQERAAAVDRAASQPANAPVYQKSGMNVQAFAWNSLNVWSEALKKNVAVSIDQLTQQQILNNLARPINAGALSQGWALVNGKVVRV